MARFTNPGKPWIWLDSAPASLSAPTTAELNAGTDLVGSEDAEELAEISGWVESASTTPMPGYASHNVPNIDGDVTYPDSMLAWYKDDTDSTIYDTVAAGSSGYIVRCPDGRGTGKETHVFQVKALSRVRRTPRDQAHIFETMFAVKSFTLGAEAA